MNSLRFLGKSALAYFGLQVTRIPNIADEGLARNGDPVTVEYMPQMRGLAMFDIEVAEARGFSSMGLPMRPDTNPFTEAAHAARGLAEGRRREAIRDALARYYDRVCPASALEAVDLDEDEAPGLKGVPAAGWIFPWDGQNAEDVLRGRKTAMRLDSLQYGRVISFSEGITAFGPVGSGKLDLEVERVSRLVASFTARGYAFERKSPMKVVALRRDDDYRWIVVQGNHRFAICAGFEIPVVPAMVAAVIRREDWRLWPHVVSGTFAAEGALKLFDRVFDGRAPRACASWLASRTGTAGPSLISDVGAAPASRPPGASIAPGPGPRRSGAAAVASQRS